MKDLLRETWPYRKPRRTTAGREVNNFSGFQEFYMKNGSIQGQNLALTIFLARQWYDKSRRRVFLNNPRVLLDSHTPHED